MLSQGFMDSLNKAKQFSIIDDRSQAVFEDLISQAQARAAKLRRQQNEITGQLIQLTALEQMLTNVLRVHCDIKKNEEAQVEEGDEKARELRAEAHRQMTNLMERHSFSDKDLDKINDMDSDKGVIAALQLARELANEAETTPVQENIEKHRKATEKVQKATENDGNVAESQVDEKPEKAKKGSKLSTKVDKKKSAKDIKRRRR